MSNPSKRLWARVDRSGGPTECWPWTGYCRPSGHGQIGIGGRLEGTHRLAWMDANSRPVPPGLYVCHTCDNPPCCNPSHLYVGTPADNSGDAVSRGRHVAPRGEDHGNARLTQEQVRRIREQYIRRYLRYRGGWRSNAAELAAEAGITKQYVGDIVRSKWRKND